MSYAKRLCLVLVVAASALAAVAQSRVPRRLEYGVLGGATMGRYTFDPKITQDMAKGYTFGVGVRYIEEKYFGLQAEAILTRRGFRDRYDLFPDLNFERDLTYLEIPVMAHVYFELGKRSVVSFDAGPKFGSFLWDKTTGNLPDDFGREGTETQNYHVEHHSMSVHNNFDYGIQAGLGYEFNVTRRLSIELSGRYYFGLGNIFPNDKTDTFENSSNQHVQIVLSVWWKHWIARRRAE